MSACTVCAGAGVARASRDASAVPSLWAMQDGGIDDEGSRQLAVTTATCSADVRMVWEGGHAEHGSCGKRQAVGEAAEMYDMA